MTTFPFAKLLVGPHSSAHLNILLAESVCCYQSWNQNQLHLCTNHICSSNVTYTVTLLVLRSIYLNLFCWGQFFLLCVLGMLWQNLCTNRQRESNRKQTHWWVYRAFLLCVRGQDHCKRTRQALLGSSFLNQFYCTNFIVGGKHKGNKLKGCFLWI